MPSIHLSLTPDRRFYFPAACKPKALGHRTLIGGGVPKIANGSRGMRGWVVDPWLKPTKAATTCLFWSRTEADASADDLLMWLDGLCLVSVVMSLNALRYPRCIMWGEMAIQVQPASQLLYLWYLITHHLVTMVRLWLCDECLGHVGHGWGSSIKDKISWGIRKPRSVTHEWYTTLCENTMTCFTIGGGAVKEAITLWGEYHCVVYLRPRQHTFEINA